ncbi:hypothetical protein [Streptomyces olivaceus]|uniref:hypothetical protein n=1 Tax=Streptomyces olivaceus TaxID=47716 RepID=UPI00365F739E
MARAARAMNEDPRRVSFIKPAVFLPDPDLVSGRIAFGPRRMVSGSVAPVASPTL